MPLFTVIFEFRGGTYISQVRSEDEASALLVWARDLDPKHIQHFGAKRKEQLVKAVQEPLLTEPVPLEGLVNVWCVGTGWPAVLSTL